jgi:hypothetical protein
MAVPSASFYLLGNRFWSRCWIVAASGGVVFLYRISVVQRVSATNVDDG